MALVDAAQKSQRLADRISAVFVLVILAMTALTVAGWLASGAGVVTALITAVAVLVVACPCALGLATLVAVMAGAGRGAQLGLLIRGGESLERVHGLATVVLDKTGTLTIGQPAVVRIAALDGGRDVTARAGARQMQVGSLRWLTSTARHCGWARQRRPCTDHPDPVHQALLINGGEAAIV
jgi:P-type Cu+ transporter